MPQGAPDQVAAKLREIRLKADRARRLAWSAGDQLTYERLGAYAQELEVEAEVMEAQRTRLPEAGQSSPLD
jgi:hypothetical protein